jgi:four helix bundle protein
MPFRPPRVSCGMGEHRRVAVQEAADLVADEVNRVIDSEPKKRLLHVAQLRKSANSVSANIAEGLGRGEGAARNDKYRTARGEAKETISHLRSNFAARRIRSSVYWRLRNRSMTVIKMLDSLLGE